MNMLVVLSHIKILDSLLYPIQYFNLLDANWRFNDKLVCLHLRYSPGLWQKMWEPMIRHDGNHGSICSLIWEHLAQGRIHQETLILGRVHFSTLAIRGQCWNIMNVYALNNRTDRATFWKHIRLQVAGEEEWCIGGDFNMIESCHDNSNNTMGEVMCPS